MDLHYSKDQQQQAINIGLAKGAKVGDKVIYCAKCGWDELPLNIGAAMNQCPNCRKSGLTFAIFQKEDLE